MGHVIGFHFCFVWKEQAREHIFLIDFMIISFVSPNVFFFLKLDYYSDVQRLSKFHFTWITRWKEGEEQ